MMAAGLEGVPHDLSSSRNFSESHGGVDGAAKVPAAFLHGEPGSVDGAHQTPNTDFVPKCNIKGKDALSALHRAASQHCRQEIANIVCQHQAGQLMPDILPQFCPQIGENAFKVLTYTQSITLHNLVLYVFSYRGVSLPVQTAGEEDFSLAKVENPVRVAFVLMVHGRSVRQLKRLIKALYHRDHYYYIHVDKVLQQPLLTGHIWL